MLLCLLSTSIQMLPLYVFIDYANAMNIIDVHHSLILCITLTLWFACCVNSLLLEMYKQSKYLAEPYWCPSRRGAQICMYVKPKTTCTLLYVVIYHSHEHNSIYVLIFVDIFVYFHLYHFWLPKPFCKLPYLFVVC